MIWNVFKLQQFSKHLVRVLDLVHSAHNRCLQGLPSGLDLRDGSAYQRVFGLNGLLKATHILSNAHQLIKVMKQLIDLIHIARVCRFLHELCEAFIVVCIELLVF